MLKNHRLALILFSVLILLSYGNSLGNVFLSDDLAEIVQNPRIGDLSYIFTHPFGFIRLILYWLAYTAGGLNPAIFRSINILFHLGSVYLIYFLFNRLYSRRLAILTAALFAVHPAIGEAVVWISGGTYPQYAFFFLLSFLLYLLGKKDKKYYLLSIVSFLFAFMSHPQMPLALFLIFPLWEFCFGTGGGLKKNWTKALPYFAISIAYVLISLSVMPERETTLQSTHYQSGGIDNPLVLWPAAISSYFELTLFPKTLTLYHSEMAFSSVNFAIRAILTLAFMGGILFAFKKNKFIFFWASFFLIALSPTLTPLRMNWVVAERYLYLPILGLLAIISFGLDKIIQKEKYRQAVYALFAVILIIFTVRTFVRNIDWKNEDNLWIATGKTSPSSPNTHNNLGDVYGRQGNKLAALAEFQKAIELKPNYGDAYHNLANTYMELGQSDKALENYANAVKFNPNLWQSHQNIAAIFFAAKQYDPAIESLNKAALINPKNLNIRTNIGIVYLAKGEKDKAKEIFNLILSVAPNNLTALQGLSEASK